jgi:hypothetical protein
MGEIVRVKHDHGVLSVRLPKSYIMEKGISRSEYMVWSSTPAGNISIKPLREVLKNGKEFRSNIDREDRRQPIPDERVVK